MTFFWLRKNTIWKHLRGIKNYEGLKNNIVNFKSCDARNQYIATQAPLPHTFTDFWAMVNQEKSNIIVVITNMVERGRVGYRKSA